MSVATQNPAQQKLDLLPKCKECGGPLVKIETGFVCLDGHGNIHEKGVTADLLKKLKRQAAYPTVQLAPKSKRSFVLDGQRVVMAKAAETGKYAWNPRTLKLKRWKPKPVVVRVPVTSEQTP